MAKNKIHFYQATFGAELELAGIDTSLELPTHCGVWCFKDGTICNSNGTANDPLKRFNRYGSEIQTVPAQSPDELLEKTLEMYKILNVGSKSFNYTTNLHVHIRIPGLRDNLDALKVLVRYANENGPQIFNVIEPVPFPAFNALDKKWDIRRYKRRLRSHQHLLPPRLLHKVLSATSPSQFYENHFVRDKGGRLLKHLFTRTAVNLTQLWTTDTIEFRHFTMSLNPVKMLSAFQWPLIFIQGALDGATCSQLFANGLKFQGFEPFDYKLDKVFRLTNVHHNSRKIVKENYRMLVNQGKLSWQDLGVEPF